MWCRIPETSCFANHDAGFQKQDAEVFWKTDVWICKTRRPNFKNRNFVLIFKTSQLFLKNWRMFLKNRRTVFENIRHFANSATVFGNMTSCFSKLFTNISKTRTWSCVFSYFGCLVFQNLMSCFPKLDVQFSIMFPFLFPDVVFCETRRPETRNILRSHRQLL